MKKWLNGILLAGSLSGLVLSAGCAGRFYASGPRPYYDYEYYPDSEVYFYPHGRLYYWHDEGHHWHSGAVLPRHYELHGHHSEHYRGHTQEPWNERR